METVQLHRWTREEFLRLGEAGIVTPESRLELIEGEILEMSPLSSRHVTTIRLMDEALRNVFGASFDVRSQAPLALGSRSVPEPDIAVVPGGPRDYRDAHPAYAVLVVEVSDSSLGFDRGPKLRLYARHGIPEYWIVDLQANRIEVYRDPSGEDYRSKTTSDAEDKLAPLTRPEALIRVADLLP